MARSATGSTFPTARRCAWRHGRISRPPPSFPGPASGPVTLSGPQDYRSSSDRAIANPRTPRSPRRSATRSSRRVARSPKPGRGAVTPGNVQFDNLRRIMVGVLAFPAQLRVEPFAGGGFAIMEALNVQVSCSSCTGSDLGQLQDEADRAATKAFFWWMGGVDIKQGRLALYGQYILTSAAANFLIQGTTHTFQGGVRYSLGSSKEGITDRQ